MKNIKTISVIALLLLVTGVVGSFVSYKVLGTSQNSIEYEFNAENITNIQLSSENARVEIIPANNPEIKVEFTGESRKNLEELLDVNVNGDTLTIQTGEQRKLFNIDFFEESSVLTVYLPDKTYEVLQANMENGRFEANDLTINEIDTETDNGRIEMENIRANSVSIQSNNGRVELADVEGEINGKTNNGSFYLSTSHLDRSIEWEAINGRIEIETEKEPTNATLDLKTTNGKAEVFGTSNWDSVVGNGDHIIKLTTKNGRISIEK